MRRCRNHDNYPVGDESATKSASCRKIPQVCQFYSMFPICQTAKLKSLFTCLYCITFFDSKQYFFVNLFLERHKISHFCLAVVESDEFIESLIYALCRFVSGYLLFVGRTRRMTQCLTPTFVALCFCVELKRGL